MAIVKMVVGNRNVRRRTAAACFDCNVVVTRVNVAMDDRDIGRAGGIDTICIARGLWRIDFDSPGGEAIPVEDNMKIRGVSQGDAVKGEVIGLRDNQNSRTVLVQISQLCVLSESPPGNLLSSQCGPA